MDLDSIGTRSAGVTVGLLGVAVLLIPVGAELARAVQPMPEPTPSPVFGEQLGWRGDDTVGGTAAFAATTASLDEDLINRAEGLSEAFRAVAHRVSPTVGRITGFSGSAEMTASCFAIRPDGYMLTNNHVVEDASSLLVEFSNGQRFTPTVVGTDALTDLAVIKIDADNLPTVGFGSSGDLQIGDWVVAIGCPLGLEQSVTAGIVSATHRQLGIIGSSRGRRGYEQFIQTDAAINQGNSGGPLVNLEGQVVGVNSAIVTRTGGSDGLGFAIPSKLATHIADQLITHGRVIRGYMGVDLQDLDEVLARSYGLPADQTGVLLTTVPADMPAGEAGLAEEDVLVAIDDVPMHSTDQLRNMVAMMEPGTQIRVDAIRDGRPLTRTVVLGEMLVEPPPATRQLDTQRYGRLGWVLQDYSRARAVVVRDLLPGGPAYLSTLERGDIIVEINDEELGVARQGRYSSRAAWLSEQLEDRSAGEVVRFKVLRGQPRRPVFVAIEVP